MIRVHADCPRVRSRFKTPFSSPDVPRNARERFRCRDTADRLARAHCCLWPRSSYVDEKALTTPHRSLPWKNGTTNNDERVRAGLRLQSTPPAGRVAELGSLDRSTTL